MFSASHHRSGARHFGIGNVNAPPPHGKFMPKCATIQPSAEAARSNARAGGSKIPERHAIGARLLISSVLVRRWFESRRCREPQHIMCWRQPFVC